MKGKEKMIHLVNERKRETEKKGNKEHCEGWQNGYTEGCMQSKG